MRDKYEVGQAAAVGPNAHAENTSINQSGLGSADEIDLVKLADELASLRASLQLQAIDAGHFVSVGEIAAAEVSAKKGDSKASVQHLAQAGKWAWDIASKIGVGVMTAAVLKQLGLK